MSKSACFLYFSSNEIIAFPAFTARSAGFAARIDGPVLSFQAIKRKPRKRFPFFDSSFFEKKLELVVEGYCPSVFFRFGVAFSGYVKCIFTMEINVLLKSNFSDSVPECYVGSCIFGQVGQNVGLEACAAEIVCLCQHRCKLHR